MGGLQELKARLWAELEELGGKAELTASEIDCAYKMVDIIKDIDYISSSGDNIQARSGVAATASIEPTTEFREAINGLTMADILNVVETHLEAVKMFFPKEYALVIAKLKSHKE